MDEREKYEYWLEHARYDMKAAEAMLNAGMWVYAIFMCQQAIEKLVKGCTDCLWTRITCRACIASRDW